MHWVKGRRYERKTMTRDYDNYDKDMHLETGEASKNYAAQGDERDKNVESMMKMDEEVHAMEPIYWKTHAQLVRDTV